ncbi:MAG: hypothetical protein A3K19_19450 [Lentisphaerae bacterium RIFOXYB12_FULL_65_16]|nr:MAG: hypothetical protein A3K18_31365 [Lentisphaerae bacterium RIFOXYA12_64_32]OGV92038.1 MAG: hypothetical protein A3K19_19450 [Lentisphaerae bacterium RIFOXYB12_FULL_65_16]
MAAPPKRKHRGGEAEKENNERWLLTYADLITLLVAFFIMMYSMSVINMEKFKEAAIAIRSGFEGKQGDHFIQRDFATVRKGKPPSPKMLMTDRPPLPVSPPDVGVFDQLNRQIATLKIGGFFQPVIDLGEYKSERFAVIVSGSIYFEPGSNTLTEDASEKLAMMARLLATVENKIQVDVYASRLPGQENGTAPWLLSAQRGLAVVDFIRAQQAFPAERFVVSSYGASMAPKNRDLYAFSSSGEWVRLNEDGWLASDTQSQVRRKDRAVISLLCPDTAPRKDRAKEGESKGGEEKKEGGHKSEAKSGHG